MEFKIKAYENYTPTIGHLVSMMNYARLTTIQAAQGLTVEQLDYVHADNANSIGALLFHIAAVEFGFQLEMFDNRKPNEQEIREWEAGYELGDIGRSEIKGNPLEFYLDKLQTVRNRTLRELQNRDDEWLFSDCMWADQPSNQYFIWFHTLEDEINHRGQIRIQRKMLPK